MNLKSKMASLVLIGLISTCIPVLAEGHAQKNAIGYKHASPNKALQKVLAGADIALMYEESWATPWEGRYKRPQKLEILGGLYNKDKHRNWTDTESAANLTFLNQTLNTPSSGGATSGALSYNWVNRGPYNKPGSFRYADLDSTDNTVWVVTNGHYGGNQYIYKGSLDGDDFKLISGNLPTRFNDMIGFSVGTQKRLLVTTVSGTPYYTDDNGQTWLKPSGLPASGILSMSVNRANGYKTYATDGQKVYVSSDSGRTYTTLKDFGNKVNESKLYSIRYGKQPGAGNLYLARNGTFYKFNGSDFVQKGTYPQPEAEVGNNGWGRFEIQGDTRKLYLHEYNEYFVSTNEGASWTKIQPQSYYYGELVNVNSERMISEQTFGVHPENPEILIGGYADWLVSKDGGNSFAVHLKGWWYNQHHEGSTPAEWVSTQDLRTRFWQHQDLQGSSFFYDKSGNVLSLRYSDGGVFKSYKEWTIPSWTGEDNTVYYNITLMNTPSQETYLYSLASGSKSLYDISWGTQDQGDQISYGTNGTMLTVIQNPGGDGRRKVTADGLTVFSSGDNAASAPTPMYTDGIFMGSRNINDNGYSLGTSGVQSIVIDRQNPSTSFWSIGDNGVSYHTWNGGGYSNSARNPGGSGRVQALAQSKSSPTTLYAVRRDRVYKSTNSGSSWGAGVGWGGSAWDRCGIAINPVDANKVLVACQSETSVGAAYSTNGGSTWADVTGSLPALNFVDLHGEKTGRFYFASTNYGPYAFDSQTLTWNALGGQSDGAPKFNGMSMEYIESANIMRYSTWGLGTWDLQITGVNGSSSSSLSSSSVQSSSSNQSSSSQISSSSAISSSSLSSSSVLSSSSGNFVDCAPYSSWQNRSYNWVASKEFVEWTAQLWSHTDWVGGEPGVDQGWSWEGDCAFASSSSTLSSSSLVSSSSSLSSSSGQVVANQMDALKFQIQGPNRQGITVVNQGDFELRLLKLDGTIMQKTSGIGNQFVSWEQGISTGAWIVEVRAAEGLRRWMVNIR